MERRVVKMFKHDCMVSIFSASYGKMTKLADDWSVHVYPSKHLSDGFNWIIWHGNSLEIGDDAIKCGGMCRAGTKRRACEEAVKRLMTEVWKAEL